MAVSDRDGGITSNITKPPSRRREVLPHGRGKLYGSQAYRSVRRLCGIKLDGKLSTVQKGAKACKTQVKHESCVVCTLYTQLAG